MIQAENGVLNLTKYLFQANANTALEKTTQSQIQVGTSSTDTFAKALEKKVEQRIAEKNQSPVAEKSNQQSVQEESRYLKNTNERTSNEKLNKKTDSDPVNEKLKELKKTLKKNGQELSPEMEEMLAELLANEELSMEQLETLTSMMESFAGMGELELAQPLTEIVEQLPEALVDQISELSEMINAQLESLKQAGGTVELTTVDAGKFQEQLESIMETLDKAINTMEGQDASASDTATEDVLKVLHYLEEVFGDALNEDGELDVKAAGNMNQIAKVFEMVESIEVKDVEAPVVEHQEVMSQELNAQALKLQEKPLDQQQTTNVSNQISVDREENLQHIEGSQEAENDAKDSREPESKWQGIEKAVANVTAHTPVQAQAETVLVADQTANQAIEMNTVTEGSKIQTVQMERVHQNILNQVVNAANMSFNLEEETSEMLIKLKPNSLGNVELKVSIEKGVLLAEFNVESETVKEALESNLADLRNALSDKGFNIHELNVSIGQEQKEQGNSSQQRRFAQKQKRIGLNAVENVFGGQSLESLSSQSTIDYLG